MRIMGQLEVHELVYEEELEGNRQAKEEIDYLLDFWTHHWEIYRDTDESHMERASDYIEQLAEIPRYPDEPDYPERPEDDIPFDNGGDSPYEIEIGGWC